ncbi:enoyl-CoA hydratase/isomerase family protein [Natrialbaceae archaeon A-CW1-1]
MTASEFVDTSVSEGIATIHVDRADRHNSLVPSLLTEMLEALGRTADDESVRVIVLRTAGPTFSTGGDVASFYDHRESIVDYSSEVVGALNDVIVALRTARPPVIVTVDGQVTGGSLGLLLAADIVVMNRKATITPYYPVVGFSPDGGWTALLPEIIGRTRTMRILATNEIISSEQALEWGLASELVSGDGDGDSDNIGEGDGAVHERTDAIAREIASMKPGSIERSKRLVGLELAEVERRLERERRAFIEQIQTEEALEGMAAFLESL